MIQKLKNLKMKYFKNKEIKGYYLNINYGRKLDPSV